MKSYLIVSLHQPLENCRCPGWQRAINDHVHSPESFSPDVDRLMRQYNLKFKVTSEFEPVNDDWNADEIAAEMNRVYRLVLKHNRTIPQLLLDQIRQLPDVANVEPVRVGSIALPVSYSKSRKTDSESRKMIRLPDAHRFSKGDPEVIVAVLDTGINLSHPLLEHALLPGKDFVDIIDGAGEFIGDYMGADDIAEDDVGHGTHVAGIIAASNLSSSVEQGVVPDCKILPVRVLAAMNQNGYPVGAGLIPNIDSGIKYAVDQGASVINMSLGIEHASGGLPHSQVIDYAKRKGVTIVAASGNDGLQTQYYPGAFKSVIAVGSVDSRGMVSQFSTFGRQVSFVAPGENIYSTGLNGGNAFSTGTSHAAPFVSGGIALLKSYARSKGMDLKDHQVKYLLKHSSDKLDRRFKHPKAGYGLLNLNDAIGLLNSHL